VVLCDGLVVLAVAHRLDQGSDGLLRSFFAKGEFLQVG
jgi:hypothetical protein